MKNLITYHFLMVLLINLFIFSADSLFAQQAKKNKVRVNVSYVKIMDGEIYFDIKTSARINKKNKPVSNAELSIINIVGDEKFELGKTTSNSKGESRFTLKNINAIECDTTRVYSISVLFKGNDSYKKAKKTISFKNVDIQANIITKDSINYISATLIDANTKSPIIDESLTVQVQRLFLPLLIGDEFNETDEDGKILVRIEEGIPGIDGNLNIEVVLNESDNYGTVKAIVKSKVGISIVDESTFDQRTMWSPRNKTPIFLLIFPNLLILGIWGIIIYLILNLFKLSKS